MHITGLDEERHDQRWEGQRALVTGSGQGIGRAVAQLLASKGVRVAVNDIVPERAETTVELITQAGGEAFTAPGDIADPDTVEHVFQQLDEHYDGIDILVNDAGIIIKDTLDDTDLERWNRILAVNLTADFLTIKQAVRRMRTQHYGRIVNVSSIAA
ncbi:SDR family NAD(P)-dependent oxidoreductase, partial [Bifidobacterium sp.]|uniref:SDR family NAD(P)-dependent oxidoreductase n=1 Tax=Bifidobacterium sp. TaxID=41200 RepID=UPI003D7ED120